MVREEAHVVVGPWVSLSRTPRAVAKRITELRLRRTVAAPVRDPSGFVPVEPVVADPGARRRVRPLADLQLQRRRVGAGHGAAQGLHHRSPVQARRSRRRSLQRRPRVPAGAPHVPSLGPEARRGRPRAERLLRGLLVPGPPTVGEAAERAGSYSPEASSHAQSADRSRIVATPDSSPTSTAHMTPFPHERRAPGADDRARRPAPRAVRDDPDPPRALWALLEAFGRGLR